MLILLGVVAYFAIGFVVARIVGRREASHLPTPLTTYDRQDIGGLMALAMIGWPVALWAVAWFAVIDRFGGMVASEQPPSPNNRRPIPFRRRSGKG